MKTFSLLSVSAVMLAVVGCGDKDDGANSDDSGTHGSDGSDGSDGADGADGSDGSDGADGSDGGTTEGLPACSASDGHVTDLDGITISGDTLTATMSYGGGCEDHEFSLCWPNQSFMESAPTQVALEILHEGVPDPCDSWATEDVDFDLVPLKEAWQQSYGSSSGEITVHVGTASGTSTVSYTF